jgi:hypothetical protein
MKKTLAFLTTLTLIFTATACSSNKSATEQAEVQFIQSGSIINGNTLIYSTTNDGGYSISYYLDLDTMETAPFCSMPNCSHNSRNCMAIQLGDTPVLYNGYGYFLEYEAGNEETPDGIEFYIKSNLKRISLTTSELETVCEFTDVMPRTGTYVLDNNELYFIGCDGDPYGDSTTGYSWSDVGGRDYICSVNLDTGAYQNYGEVCYVEDEYPSAENTATAYINGYYNGKVYIGYSFAKSYSSELVYSGNLEWTLYNFTFDLDTKTIEESELPYGAVMDEDTYVYCEDDSHFTVIDGDQTYHFEGEASDFGLFLFNGKVFGLFDWYDLSDQSVHNLGKYAYIYTDEIEVDRECIAYYDGYYIFRTYGRQDVFEKVSEEELRGL